MKKTLKIVSLFILVMMIATTCFATSDDVVVATRNDSEELSDEELEEAYQNLLSTPQYDYKYGDIYSFNNEELSNETVVYGNIYLMGEDLDINVTAVLGNIYVMGNNITITSQEVTGNIYVMGKDITINSLVDTGIYVMGEDIELNVQTYHLYAMGNTITIGENSQIVVDVRAAGKDVTINGVVGNNVYTSCENLYIGDNATVYGTTIEYSTNADVPETLKDKLVKVENDVTTVVDPTAAEKVGNFFKSFALAANIVLTIVLVILIVLTMKKSDIYRTDINKHIVRDILGGLLGLIVWPIISILLMITVAGILAGLILLLIWIVLLILAVPVALVEISKLILGSRATNKTKVAVVAIGLSVLEVILEMIPVVGGFIGLIFTVYGFGIIMRKMFHKKECCKDKKECCKTEAVEEVKTEEPAKEEAPVVEETPVVTEEPETPVVEEDSNEDKTEE